MTFEIVLSVIISSNFSDKYYLPVEAYLTSIYSKTICYFLIIILKLTLEDLFNLEVAPMLYAGDVP